MSDSTPPSATDAEPEKLTPMMQQYLGVKRQHPGAIVLFRMGDFFETFFDDAEACGRLLGLTVTSRSKEKEKIPMAGVPHHAADGYIRRLIAAKQTVVLVDQIEDPRKAKGLVKRAVTRVLSPGTYVDEAADRRRPKYLAAVELPANKRARRFGLAALDLATGELIATEGTELATLEEELARLDPTELLAPERAQEHPWFAALGGEGRPLSLRPDDLFAPRAARRVLDRVFGEDEGRGLAEVLAEPALVAAAGCLEYVESTQLLAESEERKAGGSLAHVKAVTPYVPGEALVLDADARKHLELFEARGAGGADGSLFDAIDRSATPMGSRQLGRALSRPYRSVAPIRARQDAVAALLGAPLHLDGIRSGLRRVADLERLLGRVLMGRASPRDLGQLRTALGEAPAVLDHVRSVLGEPSEVGRWLDAPSLLAGMAGLDLAEDLRVLLEAALVDEPTTEVGGDARLFRAGFDPALDELYELEAGGRSVMEAIEARERERTGIGSLKIRYNRVFGHFIEITKSNLKLVPKDYIRKQTTAGGERFYTLELKEKEELLDSASERRRALEAERFVALLAQVSASARRLKALADAFAELDLLGSFATIALERDWVRPEVDDGPGLEIEEGRHAVLEQRAQALGEPFVPNDVRVGSPETLLIITGPNMAGKSTIMRQTALIVILAHLGSFVPARRAKIGLVDRVFTRVGASDDLSRGRSTFMVEMVETAHILRAASARSLILFDEIGRGTSTFDGLAIAWAVAEHVHDELRAKCLFATHYHELTELVHERPRAANFHVAVRQVGDRIVFLRRLVPGPMTKSYGVQVARLAGIPEPVVRRANTLLEDLEAQALRADASRATAQLHLFGPRPSEPRSVEPPERAAVLAELLATDPDELSPRAAHERLRAWIARLTEGAG